MIKVKALLFLVFVIFPATIVFAALYSISWIADKTSAFFDALLDGFDETVARILEKHKHLTNEMANWFKE